MSERRARAGARLLAPALSFARGRRGRSPRNNRPHPASHLLAPPLPPFSHLRSYINSPGGSVTAGMAIYDTMQFIPCDVATVCFGTAASMGAFLLGAGHPGKRRALPNARIMIHQPLGGAQGQAADIEIQAKEILCESAAAAAAALAPPPPPSRVLSGARGRKAHARWRSPGTCARRSTRSSPTTRGRCSPRSRTIATAISS